MPHCIHLLPPNRPRGSDSGGSPVPCGEQMLFASIARKGFARCVDPGTLSPADPPLPAKVREAARRLAANRRPPPAFSRRKCPHRAVHSPPQGAAHLRRRGHVWVAAAFLVCRGSGKWRGAWCCAGGWHVTCDRLLPSPRNPRNRPQLLPFVHIRHPDQWRGAVCWPPLAPPRGGESGSPKVHPPQGNLLPFPPATA